MFKLSRYYSIASLIGISIVIFALSIFYRQLAIQTLMQHQSRANVDLANSFANSIWQEFAGLVEKSYALTGEQVRQLPEMGLLNDITQQQMQGTEVVKVKIYNLNGLTVFSTESKQIGKDKSNNAGFLQAKSGSIANEITFRDEFYAFEQIIMDRNLIATYLPIKNKHNGEIVAVFEIYSDVTALVTDMESTQYKILLGVISSLSILYLFLFSIVKRADKIISRQELERQENEVRIRYQAFHDTLTDLPNRHCFNERIVESITRMRRQKKSGALMFLDLDRFKLINDSLGHEAGDQMLRIAASRIQKCLRETDIVFRISGDEFIVIQEDLDKPEDAALAARRIIDFMRTPATLNDFDVIVTVSIGITTFPKENNDIDTLVKEADAAMYRAKEDANHHYAFFTEEMNTIALKRLTMENDLQHALEKNQFILYYQPKLDIKTRELVSIEALLRWQHPEKGLIPPNDFIPLLEDMGLINAVGEWVLKTACNQTVEWLKNGFDPRRMAINISAKQFRSQNLVLLVQQVLAECGLTPNHLELELTESMLIDNTERAIATMHELKSLGIALSIDDFGAGYSSLSYLKKFPIDFLKIDRSFIRDVNTNVKDAAITKSISALAHSLNVHVIAEGVENEEQLKFLSALNCHEVQGFLFSKPIAANEFAALFLECPGKKIVNN